MMLKLSFLSTVFASSAQQAKAKIIGKHRVAFILELSDLQSDLKCVAGLHNQESGMPPNMRFIFEDEDLGEVGSGSTSYETPNSGNLESYPKWDSIPHNKEKVTKTVDDDNITRYTFILSNKNQNYKKVAYACRTEIPFLGRHVVQSYADIESPKKCEFKIGGNKHRACEKAGLTGFKCQKGGIARQCKKNNCCNNRKCRGTCVLDIN
jgi:hypothetical protein